MHGLGVSPKAGRFPGVPTHRQPSRPGAVSGEPAENETGFLGP